MFRLFKIIFKKNDAGGIKAKNEWVHKIMDCVILDEYHYGAWREKAKDLFEAEEIGEKKRFELGEGLEYYGRN